MKIAIISHGVDGGINTISTDVFDYLSNKKQKDEITLIRVDPVYKETKKIIKKNEINITPENKKNNAIRKIFFWIASRKRIKEQLQKTNPEIVIFSGFMPLIFYKNIAKNKKQIFWEHGPQKTYLKQKKIIAKTIEGLDLIISPTQSSFEWLDKNLKINTKNTEIISNWIDYNKIKKRKAYNETKNRTIKIIVCCRLDEKQKDISTLLKFAKKCIDEKIKIKIDIYGQGPSEMLLVELIKDYKLSDTVNLLGRSNELYNLYSNYDISILPTKWEGFGLTIAESMAAGVIPISAKVEGVIDLIDHNVTGYLYNPQSEKSLYEAFSNFLLSSNENLNKIQKKILEKSEKEFKKEEQIEKLYIKIEELK